MESAKPGDDQRNAGSPPRPGDSPRDRRKRSGLGRGLGALIPELTEALGKLAEGLQDPRERMMEEEE